MRKTFTFLVILFFSISISAQEQIQYETLFDFENGMDTLWWTPFANGAGTKADLKVVLNPFMDNVNSTDSVLGMHIYTGADSWVGYWADIDKIYAQYEFPIDQIFLSDESHWLCLMINKPLVSSVRMKLELSTTGANPTTYTVADTNSVVNEWEFLQYDFSPMIGNGWKRLTIFPDETAKASRTEEFDVYVDNVGVQNAGNTVVKEFAGLKMKLYPNPATYRMAVVYPGMTAIKISGLNGQEIRTLKFNNVDSKVIEVGDLKPGTYFVTATTPKGNFTMPFIKK